MKNRKAKHVIFLGAGSSATSGYPVAADLRRKWFASSNAMTAQVTELFGPAANLMSTINAQQKLANWLKSYEQSLSLFRTGGFGTIDEFCHLLRTEQPDTVKDLKKVLRLALGFQNPEKHFATSDYYQLLQALFDPTDLRKLRNDVAILSFNYDPYLEWLLRRAIHTRARALFQGQRLPNKADVVTEAVVTSGFSHGKAGVDALTSDDGFCVLALHGLIAWPNGGQEKGGHDCSFADLFQNELADRLTVLVSGESSASDPPIIFPWEIMDSKGQPLGENEFVPKESPTHKLNGVPHFAGDRINTDPSVYRILEAVWARAREEVIAADRISFVGLSMHDYLRPGFSYLFTGKSGKIRLAITDAANASLQDRHGREVPAHTLTPKARVTNLRDSFCQSLQWSQMNLYKDFAEFLAKELGT
jgi:hypothetical protein